MLGKAFLRRQLLTKDLKEAGEWKEQREQQVQWLRGPGCLRCGGRGRRPRWLEMHKQQQEGSERSWENMGYLIMSGLTSEGAEERKGWV